MVGEMGSSCDEFFADGLRGGARMSIVSLLALPVNEFPLLVLLAEIILKLLSSYILFFLLALILGNICILGLSSYSLNDFFLVC
jgi:hypothetical protein